MGKFISFVFVVDGGEGYECVDKDNDVGKGKGKVFLVDV